MKDVEKEAGSVIGNKIPTNQNNKTDTCHKEKSLRSRNQVNALDCKAKDLGHLYVKPPLTDSARPNRMYIEVHRIRRCQITVSFLSI